jgi:hypothetical protein
MWESTSGKTQGPPKVERRPQDRQVPAGIGASAERSIKTPVEQGPDTTDRSTGFICPYCDNPSVVVQKTKMSNTGIILLVILVVLFWPLFWIGFLIRDRYNICSVCGRMLNDFDIQKGKESVGIAKQARNTKLDIRGRLISIGRQHEREGRYNDAIRVYEELELFDDAERCLRRSKGMEPKMEDPVVVLKGIRTRGMWVNYKCPFCQNTMVIDGSKLATRFCDTCSRPIDFELLSRY